MIMYSSDIRLHALALMRRGISLRSISMSTGISRATLHDWREHPEKISVSPRATCSRCADNPTLPEPQADYAYLLGLYLGDGCISLAGARDKRVWKLRIMCADTWPGLLLECERAMSTVRPANKVRTQQNVGCTEVMSCSRHWPCLFPQHGLGRKHMRKIELQPWQRTIVMANPGCFARGLFHSTVIAGLTGYGHISRTATTATSMRDTYLPTSPVIFSGCAVRPWISSGSPGASLGGTPYPWHAAKR